MEDKIINKIIQVVRYYETGKVTGADYANISIFNDGPGNRKQLTVGASQTTEYGNLKDLIVMYIAANGQYANQYKVYVDNIGKTSLPTLADNTSFKTLFKDSCKDPIMQQTQDKFFMKHYFTPAQTWFSSNGFKLPLSLLVIYDSFVHSGSMMSFLTNQFAEKKPAAGGDEKNWITSYVDARDKWLETNTSRPVLQKTDYRTDSFIYAIKQNNWNLDTPFCVVNYKDNEEKTTPLVEAKIN